MGRLTAPTLPPGPRKRFSDELHSVHRRAGWPSVRELARALGPGVASSSRIHDAFTKPRVPSWGLVQMLVVELAIRTPGLDATAEVMRLHGLWDEAAQADDSLQADGAYAALPHAPVATTGRSLPRLLLLAGLHDFSERNNSAQVHMRQMARQLLENIALAGGMHRANRYQEDRGDGFIELIEPTVSVGSLLRALLTILPVDLDRINNLSTHATRLRMRLVLARVHVATDGHDLVSSELEDVWRLLDSDELYVALHRRNENFALCVSDLVYWETVGPGHVSVPAAAFREFVVHHKSGTSHAWLHQTT